MNRFIPQDKIKKIRLLGFTFLINCFNDFYWTFFEVFILDEYYFDSEDTEPCVIDLGGHIGIPVLYFKWLYPSSRILVFEPLKENSEVLKKNILVNNLVGVIVKEKALGTSECTQHFSGGGRAGHLVDENMSIGDLHTVSVTPLSPFVTAPVTFCKMDIEGAEANVINELSHAGALHNIQHLVMEYHAFSKNNKLSDIIRNLENVSMNVSFKTDLKTTRLKKRDFTHIMLIAKQDI